MELGTERHFPQQVAHAPSALREVQVDSGRKRDQRNGRRERENEIASFELRCAEGPGDIARWAETIRNETRPCRDVFVYFKHEDEGKGPEFGQALATLAGQ